MDSETEVIAFARRGPFAGRERRDPAFGVR